jgi:hypothetical protein
MSVWDEAGAIDPKAVTGNDVLRRCSQASSERREASDATKRKQILNVIVLICGTNPEQNLWVGQLEGSGKESSETAAGSASTWRSHLSTCHYPSGCKAYVLLMGGFDTATYKKM